MNNQPIDEKNLERLLEVWQILHELETITSETESRYKSIILSIFQSFDALFKSLNFQLPEQFNKIEQWKDSTAHQILFELRSPLTRIDASLKLMQMMETEVEDEELINHIFQNALYIKHMMADESRYDFDSTNR